ncbi:MAG: hypothetical protein Q7T76_18445 [Ferruginibacter sp.]|nr:hypothetical protein [Ferruginibacter sp.]
MTGKIIKLDENSLSSGVQGRILAIGASNKANLTSTGEVYTPMIMWRQVRSLPGKITGAITYEAIPM